MESQETPVFTGWNRSPPRRQRRIHLGPQESEEQVGVSHGCFEGRETDSGKSAQRRIQSRAKICTWELSQALNRLTAVSAQGREAVFKVKLLIHCWVTNDSTNSATMPTRDIDFQGVCWGCSHLKARLRLTDPLPRLLA